MFLVCSKGSLWKLCTFWGTQLDITRAFCWFCS